MSSSEIQYKITTLSRKIIVETTQENIQYMNTKYTKTVAFRIRFLIHMNDKKVCVKNMPGQINTLVRSRHDHQSNRFPYLRGLSVQLLLLNTSYEMRKMSINASLSRTYVCFVVINFPCSMKMMGNKQSFEVPLTALLNVFCMLMYFTRTSQ